MLSETERCLSSLVILLLAVGAVSPIALAAEDEPNDTLATATTTGLVALWITGMTALATAPAVNMGGVG